MQNVMVQLVVDPGEEDHEHYELKNNELGLEDAQAEPMQWVRMGSSPFTRVFFLGSVQ
jgi:hypothetical protein